MISVLNFVVNCEAFGIEESLHGTCFGHAFSKACQYGIAEERNCKNLKYVSIKSAQIDLQKCITWLEKSGKGKHEWNNACLEIGIQPKKLNILIKTK